MEMVFLVLAAIVLSGLLHAQVPQPRRPPDIHFVPTSDQAVRAMLKLARVKKTDVVYDLGCGDGRIVIAAAKLYGARGVGIDIDPVLIRKARDNAKYSGVGDLVRFEENDLFDANLSDATVVTLYLLTTINMKLRPKLQRELRPGVRIVSNTFDMGEDWKPNKVVVVDPNGVNNPYLNPKLFLWIMPRAASRP
jgi:ubiquinone/menaquinone biosynthesis C-methylase UbiE